MDSEEELSYSQKLKKEYFEKEKENSISKKKYFTNNRIKNTNNIVNSLIHTSEFRVLRHYRLMLNRLLKNVINKKLLEMVIFAYYKNSKLSIKVMHPVAQQELNFKKNDIIFIAKQIPEFVDIKEVSIFREDRLNKFKKDFNQDFFDSYQKTKVSTKYHFFEERSVGIFENSIKNEKLNKVFEDIRTCIKKNKSY